MLSTFYGPIFLLSGWEGEVEVVVVLVEKQGRNKGQKGSGKSERVGEWRERGGERFSNIKTFT